MLVELGPVAAADVQSWTRFARRVITELRVDPGDLEGVATEDVLGQWSRLIDQWSTLSTAGPEMFRWSENLDCEVAEFLLHGLERCFHSPCVQNRITDTEADVHKPFTVHVIHAFVDALVSEGVGHEQYADQIRASLGASLD